MFRKADVQAIKLSLADIAKSQGFIHEELSRMNDHLQYIEQDLREKKVTTKGDQNED